METYTKEDLDNLQTGDRQYTLPAEKTFITLGEGKDIVAFRLDQILAAIKEQPKKEKTKEKEEKEEKEESKSKKKNKK